MVSTTFISTNLVQSWDPNMTHWRKVDMRPTMVSEHQKLGANPTTGATSRKDKHTEPALIEQRCAFGGENFANISGKTFKTTKKHFQDH